MGSGVRQGIEAWTQRVALWVKVVGVGFVQLYEAWGKPATAAEAWARILAGR